MNRHNKIICFVFIKIYKFTFDNDGEGNVGPAIAEESIAAEVNVQPFADELRHEVAVQEGFLAGHNLRR